MNEPTSIGTTTAVAPDQGSIIEAVIDAVADAEGVSPLDLDPIADVIDPDALETLFAGDGTGVSVEFDYQGYRVSVGEDGGTTVTTLDT